MLSLFCSLLLYIYLIIYFSMTGVNSSEKNKFIAIERKGPFEITIYFSLDQLW